MGFDLSEVPHAELTAEIRRREAHFWRIATPGIYWMAAGIFAAGVLVGAWLF